MSVHVDERPDGGLAFFIDGDLQFDTADEAVYHESLALPALSMAHAAQPDGLRVLICGGGDGLALRETLRFPGVVHADLVDYDPTVLELGRTRFAELNLGAFEDPRVRVHCADAWEFLASPGSYDAVICDLTVPRSADDTRVFAREWYKRVGAALSPSGVAAINGVSPQATPEAFWCLRKTIRSAGLSVLPYRVCIPSFRAQGYGVWSFMLASRRALQISELHGLHCPVSTRQADISALWRGASFDRSARAIERQARPNTLDDPCLIELLLNPGRPRRTSAPALARDPYDLEPLISAIPVVHPYHTRDMVETLARNVVGTVRSLDIRRLVDAILDRAAALPDRLVAEMRRLKEWLHARAFVAGSWQAWGYRLFAALVITITVCNALAPDTAFAKGASGLGHASFSRGFSGGFGGGHGGFTSPTTTRGGLFAAGRTTGSGFRGSGYRTSGGPVDRFGTTYRPRVFMFYGGGYHSYGGGVHGSSSARSRTSMPVGTVQRKALFVADDDMLVLDNGDVVVTLSDAGYLLITEGRMLLMSSDSPDPIMDMQPDPALVQAAATQIQLQQTAVKAEAADRQDWLSWVGWTSALFPSVAGDRTEVRNMQDLVRQLGTARSRLTSASAPPARSAPAGATELFVGGYLLDGRVIALRGRDGWVYTDGRDQWTGGSSPRKAVSPRLVAILRSVLTKLSTELAADIRSDASDLQTLAKDKLQLQRDLQEYRSIYAMQGYNGSYEVDYGTDSMPVQEAIARTESDIAGVTRDESDTIVSRERSIRDLARVAQAAPTFGK